jgi:hypothetical protein
MGGLASKMPFLSGAYSKDLILEIAYLQATTLGRLYSSCVFYVELL